MICEKADRSDIPDIDKKKYLVPADLSTGGWAGTNLDSPPALTFANFFVLVFVFRFYFLPGLGGERGAL